ncbi:MAG: hypothetical protein QG559_350 [Campylobacterota bacterium]|nr:hypothetical protein [Campylobacterota bacterium]
MLGLDALVLILQINQLSISYDEASLFFGEFSLLQLLVKFFVFLFGQNDFALRLPMICMHIASALLLYKISQNYLKLQRNRLWLLLFFILLPGIISSAIIVNSAGLMIFGLLLFVYIYQNFALKYSYIVLFLLMLSEGNFLFLFVSLAIFSLYAKNRNFLILNIFLFAVSLFLYGIDTHGSPKGYFLDSIGLYAAIFTPIVFVYMVYALYRKFLTRDIDILWFIATVTFIISLALSFRQRVGIEYFAPYLVLALPLMAQVFEHSYRVRLSIFRKRYKFIFIISLIFLVANSALVFFNKYLYLFIDEPKKHFSYKMHIAKELSSALKKEGINCIKADSKMSKRLQFYGVTKCNTYKLEENKRSDETLVNVTISYRNKIIYFANVTKGNNL